MAELFVNDHGGVSIKLAPPKIKSSKSKMPRVKISEATHRLFDNMPSSFWSNLAVAIVYRACLDYEDALVHLYFSDNQLSRNQYYYVFRKVQRFFGSKWYYILVDVDPKVITRKLDRNVARRLRDGQEQRTKGHSFATL